MKEKCTESFVKDATGFIINKRAMEKQILYTINPAFATPLSNHIAGLHAWHQ